MIALTILPFAPATQIERYVRKTKKIVSNPMSATAEHFQVGMTILSSFQIRSKNTESTLPLP